MIDFALNHMAAPRLAWDDFLQLAASIGCVGVEFRNDLQGPLFGGDAPEIVGAACRDRGLRILALAEVKMFDNWSDAKRDEASDLMSTAVAARAEAVSLIPRNDGIATAPKERKAALGLALRELLPMLRARGLKAMVEPLGFETCSQRYKAEVVEAIEALDAADTFKLVHDTFHHHLAGGGPVFPDHTGIVHISGVTDPAVGIADMRDAHRVLVDTDDRLDNIGQIAMLLGAGYAGPISFEPFSPAVHALRDPASALKTSMTFISGRAAAQAA